MIRFLYKFGSFNYRRSDNSDKLIFDLSEYSYYADKHYIGINISKLYISSCFDKGFYKPAIDDKLLLYFDKDHKGYFNNENDYILWKLKYGI